MRTKALLLLLPAVAAAGCGSSNDTKKASVAAPAAAKPASAGPVTVKLGEWQVAPSTTTIKAGKVRIDAANDGNVTHELIVLRTDKPAASLGSGKRVSEAGSVGELSDLKASAAAAKTFDLKPGHYVLMCNLPGHYAAGMRADLTVR
jgi:uncharacterized cupredoxin-like copper-binding protein